MNYLPKVTDLMQIAYFFCKNYDYEIDCHSERIEGMGCALISLKHNQLPSIKIEMERYFIDFQLVLQQDTSLVSIYKFFHTKEILRNSMAYRKKKNFRNYYIEDQNKYFIDFLEHRNTFDFNKFLDFYEKYPFQIWKWIEK